MSVTLFGIVFLGSLFWPRAQLNPIVGGRVVLKSDIGQNSYIVSLQEVKQFNGIKILQHFCGGSLISEDWILTAAHCVNDKQAENVVAVIGKESLLTENVRKYPVLQYHLNNFHPYSLRNDIALMKIDRAPKEVQNKKFPVINLPRHVTEVSPNYTKICQILGYGANKYGGTILNRLYIANVSLLANEECTEYLGNIMAPQDGDNKICALGNGTDTCQGDSGGPLICSDNNGIQFIYGIVSQGLHCGLNKVPSIYTVVDKYLQWINDTIIANQ